MNRLRFSLEEIKMLNHCMKCFNHENRNYWLNTEDQQRYAQLEKKLETITKEKRGNWNARRL